MKKTYKFSLPQSKEVEKTNIRVENGEILVDVEFKDKFEPKDGDFIKYECCGREGIFIYKDGVYNDFCGCYCGISSEERMGLNGRIILSEKGCHESKRYCRYATANEKRFFLNRLVKEYHKRWNAETKTLEDINIQKPADNYVPKFGDIVVIEIPNEMFKRDYVISIFPNKEVPKENTYFFFDIALIDLNGHLIIKNAAGYYNINSISPATESEKQELFDKLAKAGKRWNSETKTLEDIRWMPKEREIYFYIDSDGMIEFTNFLCYNDTDKQRIVIGNCFKTKGAAQPYAEKFKEIFKNSKAE